MLRQSWIRVLVVLVAASLATGCVLLFEDGGFQSISLHFSIDREIPAGEAFDVEMLVHPGEIGLRRTFAQISGMLIAPDGEQLPSTVELIVLTETDTGRQVDRIRKSVRIREDGGFKESQRIRRDIPAGALQSITVEPQDMAIPSGTKLWLCLDIVEKKADLQDLVDCSASDPVDPSETVIVRVIDDAFQPQRVRVAPGETVRWVFDGADVSHSVTSDDPSQFDSGFIFRTPGDFFEVTFGADKANQEVEYFCRSHRECCQMVGVVEVGS